MYDKVKWWLPRTQGMSEFEHLKDVIKKEDPDAFSMVNATTGEVKVLFRGHLRNIQITEYLSGVSMIGSLNKFANEGANLKNMTLEETRETLSQLQDSCHIDLAAAHVSALEFGFNFHVANEVSRYLKLLGDMPRRLRKSVNDETLYYVRNGRERDTFTLYDKLKDAKKKKMEIPSEFDGKNLLRVELRYSNGIARLLNEKEVTGDTLTKQCFINKLINNMCEKYNSIQKLNRVNLQNVETGKTEREYFNLYVSVLAQIVGDKFTIDDFIAALKDADSFSQRSQYSRLRKKMYDAITDVSLCQGDPLREELDEKFEALKSLVKM